MRLTATVSSLIVAFWLALTPYISLGHHSVAGFFDPNTTVEIEGVVQKVRWRNPHTIFLIDVTEESGEITTWTIESGALGVLRSRGLAREFVAAGDYVKVMGDSSLRSRPEMFARNMLLSDGKEVMLTAGSMPHFTLQSTGVMLESEFDDELIATARQSADGIFRVWSTNIDERPSSGGRMLRGAYPLKAAAEAKRSEYDAGDEALLGCTSWSMPRLMTNPLPMEFVRNGETIVQRFEENDSVRVIYMNADPSSAPDEFSIFGYSTGRWDGKSLIVETSRVTPERFDNVGTPFSGDMRLLERFTPNNDGSRLDYRLTVTDPNTFTEPFEVGRYWIWRPEMQVRAYDCEQDQKLP